MYNDSGMNQVASTMSEFERRLGIDSSLANAFEESHDTLIDRCADADVHVSHTYLPEWFKRHITNKNWRLVWVGHGTPEHIFLNSAIDAEGRPYGHNDGLMLFQYYLQHADAIITHWPRHAALYRTLVDKRTQIHTVPLGIDLDFWKPTPSAGDFAGDPSLFSAENCHYIKWPYDLFVTWPLVYPRVHTNACLHVSNLPLDQHRFFFPLVNRNGSSYAAHITSTRWGHNPLRNIFNSVDYFIGLVLKGDFNRLSLEAAACGCTTISYRGNPYSHFWLTEGDQRTIADELVAILNKETPPRTPSPVPSAAETALAMKSIYESL